MYDQRRNDPGTRVDVETCCITFVLLHYILLSASSVSDMVAVSALSKLRISYVDVLYKLRISSVYALCKLCSMSESESGRILFAGGFIPIPIPDGRQLAFDIYCHDRCQHVRSACAVPRQLRVRSRIFVLLSACVINVEMIKILVWMWRSVASTLCLVHFFNCLPPPCPK
jgi:hypothetical protein